MATRGSIRLDQACSAGNTGLTQFDLDQPTLRMSYYRIVLAGGLHDDMVRYLNRGLLIDLRPTVRTGGSSPRRGAGPGDGGFREGRDHCP